MSAKEQSPPAPSRSHRQPSDADLPFTIGTLRKAVPAHCFERSLLRSSLYLLADLTAVALLFLACLQIDRLPWWAAAVAWPVYWLCQVRTAVRWMGSLCMRRINRFATVGGIFPVAHCRQSISDYHRCSWPVFGLFLWPFLTCFPIHAGSGLHGGLGHRA